MGTRLTLTSRVLVTVVVGGLAYLISRIYDPSEGRGITIAVVVGATTLIIQYVIDLDQRVDVLSGDLEKNRRAMEELVESSFSRINQATELFSQVETSVLRTDELSELVRSVTGVASVAPEIVREFAQEEIGRLAAALDGMSRGMVDRDGEDHDWIVALTHSTRNTVDAISTSMDHGFWISETGRRYLRAQREAIQTRGVRIRRLFLVAGADDVDEGLRRECDNQLSLGIEVRVLALEARPASVRLGATNDFVVFDSDLSYEVSFDFEGLNATTTLNLQPDRVRQRVQRFNELWEAATQ